jgi:hypothetical protein
MTEGDVKIQYLTESGWSTTRYIAGPVNSYMLTLDMQETARMLPGRRVRAVDTNDRVIDILN